MEKMYSINLSINATDNTYNSSLQHNFACDYSNDTLPIQTVKILVFLVILLSSLVGNTLILIIVYSRPELKKTINYFIVNMAVSDFIFPFTAIPFNILEIASNSQHWPIGGTTGLIMCKFKWYLRGVSTTVSIESLVCIAVDRFVAVVFPMKLHLFSSRSRAWVIASTWVLALLANAFHFYAFELVKQNEKTICSNFHNLSFSYMTFSKVYTILLQIVPMIAMTILYSAIAVNLRRQDNVLRSQSVQRGDQQKRRAIKMALLIMLAFYMCVLPMMIYIILWEYNIRLSCSFIRVYPFYASLMLYLSSAINPLICMSFVQSYRSGLRDIFYSCWCKWCEARNNVVGERQDINLQRIGTK